MTEEQIAFLTGIILTNCGRGTIEIISGFAFLIIGFLLHYHVIG